MTICISALTLAAFLVQGSAQMDTSKIQIIDTGEYFYLPYTSYTNLGPQVGNVLNAHYFPAMKYYEGGRYREASIDLTYFIDRPDYTDGNANQANYMSTALYARGMIYFYHAMGVGRLSIAMNDFEAAIKWNAKNYLAYLELSRVFSTTGFKDQAASILQVLLDSHPADQKVAEDARRELNTLISKLPADTSVSPLGHK
jgi:hypothetical protein